MTNRPSISVVIPAYNRTHLLLQAIDSLVGQMREGDEIIVVDDGSTEPTAEQAVGRSPLVRAFKQANTANLCQVRNRGAREARGELLSFLDSDDLAAPGCLDLQAGLLLQPPGYNAVIGAQWRFAGETPPQVAGSAGFPDSDPAPLTGCVLCRTKSFLESGGFNERITAYEVGEWLSRVEAAGLGVLRHRKVVMLRRSHGSGHFGSEEATKGRRMAALKSILDQRRAAAHAAKPLN